MRNILVPTDFSEVSKNALNFAIKIAHAEHATITLFHSDAPQIIAVEVGQIAYSDSLEEEDRKEANSKMDSLLEYIESHHVKGEKLIRLGLLGDAIQDAVEKTKSDLIVTGMHNAKGLERLLLQTNSLNMMEKVKCPVLIVPAQARYHGIKKIMYATDFQFGDIEEIKNVCKLAQFFDADVIATHVNTELDKTEIEEENMDWFATIGDDRISYGKISYRTVYNRDVSIGLSKAIELWNIDILCLSTVKKNFFKRIVSKNTMKEMAYMNIPLLAIHLSEDNKME